MENDGPTDAAGWLRRLVDNVPEILSNHVDLTALERAGHSTDVG
jgi:hypothetical protein